MIDAVIRSYGRALIDLLTEEGIPLTKVIEELRMIEEIGNDTEISRFLKTPEIETAFKTAVFDMAFRKESCFNETTIAFVKTLIANNRFFIIGDELRFLQQYLDEKEGIVRAEVTTVSGLDEEVKEKLRINLERRTGKKVIMETTVDPGIIGGIIVKIDGTVTDESLLNKLNEIKDAVIGNR